MSTYSFRSLRTFWEDCFRYGLTRPGYNDLVVVLAGWVLTHGPRAITEALVATGVSGRRHWEAYHRLFSRGSSSPDVPSTSGGAKGGRPRTRGALLRKPEKLAKDRRTSWKTTVAELYGQRRTIRHKTLVGQWYRATGTRVLKVVVVECDTGNVGIRVFFSSDPTLDIATVLETYAGRWGIEVFFRDAKQLLGFADSQSRKEAAVLRIAPIVGLLYSVLVLWFADSKVQSQAVVLPERPWYPQKRGFAFTDILRAARRTGLTFGSIQRFRNLRQPSAPNTTARC